MRTYYRGGNAVDVGVATMFAVTGDRTFALARGVALILDPEIMTQVYAHSRRRTMPKRRR